MQETVSRQRPIGVTILSVLLGIQGIVELILGIVALVVVFAIGHTIVVHGHTTIGHVVDALGGVLGVVSLIVGLVTLLLAWGLWTLKSWAFWFTVIIEVISLIRHLLEFASPNHSTVSIVIGLILPVVILLYFLVDSNVRRAFRV